VAAARLLAHVVRDLDLPSVVEAWEQPWIRRRKVTTMGRALHVRLPAAAVLREHDLDGGHSESLLLVPDYGTLPVVSYGHVLRQLIELRRLAGTEPSEEPLLVVGVRVADRASARQTAWESLIDRAARQAGEPPLRARVLIWPEVGSAAATRQHVLGDQTDQMFSLVARHPLLDLRQLAMLLNTSSRRATRLVGGLVAAGWIRLVQPVSSPPHPLGLLPVSKRTLVELTPAGRREAAHRLMLPATRAARHHGVLGTERDRRFGRHLAHTFGANAIFVAFVSAARRMSARGAGDALEEWRSAAACARGRFRPDGFGCYRHGATRIGFFLEFDRGTEKARAYAAKLDAYYRYRDSSGAGHDYAGFPVLLIVTTSEAAEGRFAEQAALAGQRQSRRPLSVFLTTTGRIRKHPDGVLGSIWRYPGWGPVRNEVRVCWLPDRRTHLRSLVRL
jgi:hypothetical protein